MQLVVTTDNWAYNPTYNPLVGLVGITLIISRIKIPSSIWLRSPMNLQVGLRLFLSLYGAAKHDEEPRASALGLEILDPTQEALCISFLGSKLESRTKRP